MHELLETSETAAIRYAGVDRNTSALEEVWRLVVILWMKRPSTDDPHSAAGRWWPAVSWSRYTWLSACGLHSTFVGRQPLSVCQFVCNVLARQRSRICQADRIQSRSSSESASSA